MHQKYIIQPLAFFLGAAGVVHGGLSKALVVGRVKNAAQDGGPLGGGGVQQPGEIVLRQHRHLRKLLGVNAQQLDNGVRHSGGTADRLVRLADELGLGGHLDHAAAGRGVDGLGLEVLLRGGMVKVKINGKREILHIDIHPDIVDPDDIETLSDVVTAAVNEAIKKVDSTSESEMQKITGGLNIPGLL